MTDKQTTESNGKLEIPDNIMALFATVQMAVIVGQLALIPATQKSDGKAVWTLCLANTKGDGASNFIAGFTLLGVLAPDNIGAYEQITPAIGMIGGNEIDIHAPADKSSLM